MVCSTDRPCHWRHKRTITYSRNRWIKVKQSPLFGHPLTCTNCVFASRFPISKLSFPRHFPGNSDISANLCVFSTHRQILVSGFFLNTSLLCSCHLFLSAISNLFYNPLLEFYYVKLLSILILLQCKVSVKRLTGYLQADELDENSVNYSTSSESKY